MAKGRSRSTWRGTQVSWAVRTLLAVCCSLACLAGCQEDDDPWLARVQKAGVLRVGMDPSWPPFESVDPESGDLVGLDVDLARAVAQKLGVEVAYVPSGWEGLYGALFAGQFDAIISALPYDGWRTKEALYSISYLNAGPVIAAHAEEGTIVRTKDLAGRTVHVEYGAEGDVQARRLRRRVDGLTIAPHDTARAALEAAAADPNSAAIVDAVSARMFIREAPGLQIVGEPLYDELYVIAVHPRASSLQKAIDQALIEMRESGELDALLDRWL
ncbi:MAG: amino acid ABC transporter substrate-binding protein [Anaerolineae bacterium]|nr:amino acid ABC transporter substrate-binding protein [Anaerolineae bacterium]